MEELQHSAKVKALDGGTRRNHNEKEKVHELDAKM